MVLNTVKALNKTGALLMDLTLVLLNLTPLKLIQMPCIAVVGIGFLLGFRFYYNLISYSLSDLQLVGRVCHRVGYATVVWANIWADMNRMDVLWRNSLQSIVWGVWMAPCQAGTQSGVIGDVWHDLMRHVGHMHDWHSLLSMRLQQNGIHGVVFKCCQACQATTLIASRVVAHHTTWFWRYFHSFVLSLVCVCSGY